MNVNNYEDYILDMIVESVKNNETKLFISNRLYQLLDFMSINKHNNIANHFIGTINNDNFTTKQTYIDLDDSGLDMVSFITSPKAIELINNEKPYGYNNQNSNNFIYNYNVTDIDNNLYKKNRTKIKIGRLITKLYGSVFKVSGEPGKDIESFVNIFKSLRDIGEFELVNGYDIKKYYYEDTYMDGNGKLNNSCMRYFTSQNYIEFYSKNTKSVSLLILKDKDDSYKIRGRALVWNLELPIGRTFMDRIYTVLDSDVELFKDYAIKNGWLYKFQQSMYENEKIVDPINGVTTEMLLVVENMQTNNEYPYVDTLKCYNPYTSVITNDENYFEGEGYYYLESTDGGYGGRNGEDDSEENHEGQTYVEYYGGWYYNDDLIYCEKSDEYRLDSDCFYSDYYNCDIADDYANDVMVDCDYYIDGDNYRETYDAVELSRYGEYATQEYLNSEKCKLTYIENSDEWLKPADICWSDHYNDYLDKDHSIEVYTDIDRNDTDWRIIDDNTYHTLNDGDEYDINVEDEDEDDE